jgi:hypothetical protein
LFERGQRHLQERVPAPTGPARERDEPGAWTDAYREFWDASFDRLGAYLKQLQQPTGGRHARRRKR